MPGGTHCAWALELIWMGPENLAPTGIRMPDRPALAHRNIQAADTYAVPKDIAATHIARITRRSRTKQ